MNVNKGQSRLTFGQKVKVAERRKQGRAKARLRKEIRDAITK